jgi:hypothetical protein
MTRVPYGARLPPPAASAKVPPYGPALRVTGPHGRRQARQRGVAACPITEVVAYGAGRRRRSSSPPLAAARVTGWRGTAAVQAQRPRQRRGPKPPTRNDLPGVRRSSCGRPRRRRCACPRTPADQADPAIDAHTVEFQLCNPDVAFLPKVAFTTFAIDDSDFLPSTPPTSRTRHPEQHRPLQAQGMEQGQPDRVRGKPGLLGHQGAHAGPQVPLGDRPRSGSWSSSPAASTASTTPVPTTRTSRPTRAPSSTRAKASAPSTSASTTR